MLIFCRQIPFSNNLSSISFYLFPTHKLTQSYLLSFSNSEVLVPVSLSSFLSHPPPPPVSKYLYHSAVPLLVTEVLQVFFIFLLLKRSSDLKKKLWGKREKKDRKQFQIKISKAEQSEQPIFSQTDQQLNIQ